MRKLIIANWKMNPASFKEALLLAKAEDLKGAVIVPPFVFLESIGKVLKQAELGAQDVFWKEQGAYTGEISAEMLKSLKVKYIIVGHSEQRALGETDKIINKKLIAVIKTGLTPILCVGEPLSVRKKGLTAAKNFVKTQLLKNLNNIESYKALPAGRQVKAKSLIIAYEPVWAIGTGIPDNPASAAKMHIYIKSLLTVHYSLFAKIIYGGSVNSKNIESFIKNPAIDGTLVGGASLKPTEFKIIVKIAKKV